MNYFVPPQGFPGLVQMPQVVAGQVQVGAGGGYAPQVLNAAGSHQQLHMVPQQMQHLQPGLIGAPRVVPVAQAAQLQQLNYAVAVSQYQQAQALRQQQSIQRAITSVSLSAPRTTPSSYSSYTKTPPPQQPSVSVALKPTTTDAEVQTPEYDANPEADSSTKARIITPNLAMCRTVVSSDYKQLQSRILTWGENNERQALEVSRVKADFSPSTETSPVTAAAVIIIDDGQVQFNVGGTVIESRCVTDKDESPFDEQQLREHLDMLGENYTYCKGLSKDDLQSVTTLSAMRCNNLIKRQNPVSGAFSVDCIRWFDIAESGEVSSEVKCSKCEKALEKLNSVIDEDGKKQMEGSGKRSLNFDDLPSEPKAKRPRLIEAHTAKMHLDTICDQMRNYAPEGDNSQESLKNFLFGLVNDIQNVSSSYEDVELESEKVQEESLIEKESQQDTSGSTQSEMIQNESMPNGVETKSQEENQVTGDMDSLPALAEKLEGKEKSAVNVNEDDTKIVNGEKAK